MKKRIILPALAIITIYGKAQTIRIVDKSNYEPIQGVVVKDKEGKAITTNYKGEFKIEEFNNADSLWLIHPSYYNQTVLISALKDSKIILMQSKMIELDEVIFSANKTPESKNKVPFQIETISQKEIEFSNQATTGDLLQNTGQVFVQKSQMGGSSPVLRGFEANRVLIVLDGVRMNNAIYRGGHLQDIITFDQNMLESTEVLFGPSSVIYGSDALGGVMHLKSKNALFSDEDKSLIKVNAMTRYASAANEKSAHLDFNIGLKKLSLLTNVTFSDFDDLKSGGNRLNGFDTSWKRNYYVDRINDKDTILKNDNWQVQKFSGYSQLDMMQRINYKLNEKSVLGLNAQYSLSSDIPRYDRLTDRNGDKLKFAEWKYGPQKRLFGALYYENNGETVFSDYIKLSAALQKINQVRITRRFKNYSRITQMEEVLVYSLNADLKKQINQSNELKYGLDINHNDVKSAATSINITNNTETKAQTRYPDGGSTMTSVGVYVSHSYEFNKGMYFVEGIRYSLVNLKSTFSDTTFFKFPFSEANISNGAFNGNLGIVLNGDDGWKVNLLGSTGFRNPNLDDMSKIFEVPTGSVIVPNTELKPEYAYNTELGISKGNDKYKFELNTWYTFLDNAMILKDDKFNGKDSALYNGVMSKVQSLQNADQAYLYGFSGGFFVNISKYVVWKNTLTYTYGRYIELKKDSVAPLDHIPPVFGQSNIIFKDKRFEGEFFVRFNSAKKISNYRLGAEDNEIYATPSGMPAWFTVNIRTGINVTKYLRINIACENITDNHYRTFASGISAPGRNFIMSLRFKL